MKLLPLAALSALLFTAPAFAQSEKPDLNGSKAKTALKATVKLAKGEKTVTFSAPKMHCGGCAMGIKQALMKQNGVKAVNANPQTKRVAVTYVAAKQSPKTLAAALTKAGWPATEVKTKS